MPRTYTPIENLNSEERWIEEHADEFVEVPNPIPSSTPARTALNMRVPTDVILKLKAKAAKLGMPYQTYINSELYKLANQD